MAPLAWRHVYAGDNEISNQELGTRALQIVVSELKSTDSDVREMSVKILGETGNKAVIGTLKKMLMDISKHVQIQACESLYMLGDTSGLKKIYEIIIDVPGKNPITNSPLVQLKIISMNKIREHAIESLVRIKKEEAEDLLFQLKNDAYGEIRDVAARELARLGHDREIKQFVDALESEDEAIRHEGAVSLSKICNSDAAGNLKSALLKEKSMRVKIAILDAVQCLDFKKPLLPEVLKLAEDTNRTIRFKAVSILSDIKNKTAFEKLKKIYEDSPDISIRMVAMKGLLEFGEKQDLELLKQALSLNDNEIKQLALSIIEKISVEEAKPLLSDCLKDLNQQIKLKAALQILKRLSKKQNIK
jgi:HEAT repeat protein